MTDNVRRWIALLVGAVVLAVLLAVFGTSFSGSAAAILISLVSVFLTRLVLDVCYYHRRKP